MTEDHPYDYKDFKGVIPEGNYGAGVVEIWDKGFYTAFNIANEDKPDIKLLKAGLKKGDLKFVLKGKKLKGEFVLVKLKKEEPDDNAWLLIKHKDKYAIIESYNSEEHTPKNSPINKLLATTKTKNTKKVKVKK